VLNVEKQILNATEENPGLSTRQLVRQFNISQWVVSRTLHEQLLYPYHVQRVQGLSPADYPVRRRFCR
jgi:hypothetical protein